MLLATLLNLLPIGNKALLERNFTSSSLQLGYYDLLAHQREIYDTRFITEDKTTIMTLTSPNDNRFIAKISLEQKSVNASSVAFHSHQVYYADSGSTRMIRNILGYEQNRDLRFEMLKFGDDQLLFTPSGQIFNYQ